MKEQDFNKIAPNGLMDLTEKVRAHLTTCVCFRKKQVSTYPERK
jgi:hypothetical protein